MIYQSKNGFIALITVIIISAILLGLASAANTAGYFNRFTALDAEYKRTAFARAESCSNVELLSLAQNYAYAPAPNTPVALVGSTKCTINSITDVGPALSSSRTVLITTSATYGEAFSTVEVEATIANPSVAAPGNSATPAVTILSWQEVQ